MMNGNGEIVGRIKEMQNNGAPVQEAKKGDSIAVSMEDVTFGRQIKENETLYTFMNDENERLLRYKFDYLLTDEDRELNDEISAIKRKNRKVG